MPVQFYDKQQFSKKTSNEQMGRIRQQKYIKAPFHQNKIQLRSNCKMRERKRERGERQDSYVTKNQEFLYIKSSYKNSCPQFFFLSQEQRGM